MTTNDSNFEQNERHREPQEGQVKDKGIAEGRRRLIKIGASSVPVAMALASKPVLAWHCKSPSAWGSEQLNPNTSLKNNAGHTSYPDETWTISNWATNTARTAVGLSSAPWAELFNKYPCLKNTSCNLSLIGISWSSVTVSKLFSVVPIGRPSGLSGTAKVKDVLAAGGTLANYIICAQLNYLLLAPRSDNLMEQCITLDDLKVMATTGKYTLPNSSVTWLQADIVNYLYNNWFTRPT